MNVEISAGYAEILVSPEYRAAINASFAESPESYLEQRDLAETIALNGLRSNMGEDERRWEVRRQSALAELRGDDLGPFNDYFQRQGGVVSAKGKELDELEPGEPQVVATNSRIVGLKRDITNPIEFIDAALNVIDSRNRLGTHVRTIGPENYATALKFFTDKHIDSPDIKVDKDVMRMRVDRCLNGYWKISRKDSPNFVELTNIYASIKNLPQGAIGQRHTRYILEQSFEALPDFSNNMEMGNNTLSVLIGALGKLDLSEHSEAAATLIDLTLRKGKKFETTRDYIQTLQAIANLSPNPAANRCFASFMAARNNLEGALDIAGCAQVNEQLEIIASGIVDDPRLAQVVKALAYNNMVRASNLFEHEAARQKILAQHMEKLQDLVQSTGQSYQSI